MAAPMSGVAFALVIASAFAHAGWNFLLKRSDDKTAFLWSLGGFAAALLLLPAIAFAFVDRPGLRGLIFGGVSGGIHGVYGITLSRGYQVGDLSKVYPISRGMGPALIPLFAVILFDESVSLVAAVGIGLVVLGVYAIHLENGLAWGIRQPLAALASPATRLALLTGSLIATYSLWDKAALNYLSPITLNGFSMAGHFLVLTPLVLASGRERPRQEWRRHRRSIAAAGVLAPLAYTLVLVALTTSQLSYIAPVREVGIVIGTAMGVLFLSESYGRTRALGAALIVAGVISLGVAP